MTPRTFRTVLLALALAGCAALRRPGAARVARARVARAASPTIVMADTLQERAIEAAANAAIAAAEVTAGDRVRAPDAAKTYVSLDSTGANTVDETGLPEVYDAALIEKYWRGQGSALQSRWSEFVGVAVPFLTRVASLTLSGGVEALEREAGPLARAARENMEQLGPTYIKLGQMMSVRPDVLPQPALDELAILQDSVPRFDSAEAMAVIEAELGRPVCEVFSSISAEPVAAASLAQVYRATLASSGREVAVKVQRPGVLERVSKDLYVLRRAAEVYQNLMERLAPQQRTDYVALLNEWSIGFYTELDFTNEGANQMQLRAALEEAGVEGVLVPEVLPELSTRRVLVSEWVDGTKLSDLPAEEVRELIAIGQEAFLVQLLRLGIFHADPHPGNLMRLNGPPRADGKRLVLLDFGLVARVRQEDRDTMISALIHLANKDYTSLVDDFITLEILPADTNRPVVVPLMDRALTPYIQGGGARKYGDAVLERAGGFQAMTQDMLTVLNEVPFTIPPYFALLARAIVTLEGIALTGNPDYSLVLEAYPFIARRLLADGRPETQRALTEALYGSGGGSGGGLKGNRIAALLNSALGVVERDAGAVDLDRVPQGAVDTATALRYVLSDEASSLRALLQEEAAVATDLVVRQTVRRALAALDGAASSLSFGLLGGGLLPSPLDVPVPFVPPPATLPGATARAHAQPAHAAAAADGARQAAPAAPALTLPSALPTLLTPRELLEAAAPKLSQQEELYLLSLADLAAELLGPDAAAVVNGDAFSSDVLALPRLLLDGARALARGTGQESLADAARGALDIAAGRAQPGARSADAGAGGSSSSSVDELGAAIESLGDNERRTLDDAVAANLERTWASVSARLAEL